MLQLEKSEARRMISGTVHAYKIEEIRAGGCRSIEDYANEHGTPAQRAYNDMCIAYGADPKLFADFVSQGYLPMDRAEFCEDEYFQVKDAFELTVHPHLDLDLAKKILDGAWVCESDGNPVPGEWQHCVSVLLE